MFDRCVFFRKSLLCGLILTAAPLLGPAPAFAAASLSISPITWNIVGLDSNNVNVGPNHFPVGARVCNTGDAPATNLISSFVWDSANPLINLRAGTLTDFNATPVPSLAPADCHDFYYEVEVTRNPAAYDTTRRYHITASADGLGTVSTPTPRELYVEHLISQARNHVLDVRLDGVSIPNGGSMTLLVGQTYTIDLVGTTATNGYEQLESFINFPNTIFQVLSVTTTYTADTAPDVGNPDDKLYGDACRWENDPNSPYYRACRDVGKVGGGVVVSYEIRILQVPGAPLVNPQPLSTMLFDFSGSSYHYNDDFSTSTRYAAVVDPTNVGIAKSFSPDPTNVNGVSALTFTITNPNPAAVSGVSFTDVFPTSPGAMVVANPAGATTNGCGTPTFAPVAGAGSITFSNGTVAANSSCTVKVNVTVPATGTYMNTSNPLFVGGIDTGNVATDTLVVDNAPPPPTPVCGLTLAQWAFPAGFSATAPAPSTDNVTGTPSAKAGDGVVATSFTEGTNSWGSNGSITTGTTLVFANEEYLEFAVDMTGYTGLELSFQAARKNTPNSPQGLGVYAGTSSLTTDAVAGNGAASDPGTVVMVPAATALPLSTTAFSSFGSLALPNGTTHVRIYLFNSGNVNSGSDIFVDNVTFTGCFTPSPPTITKSFSPSPVAVGGASTLTFTVTNPNAGSALSGIAFDDTLPSGVTVTSGSSSQCGGTLTRTAPSTLSFTGGSLAAGASCTITAPVTVTTAGPHDNVSGFVTSTEGGTNTGTTGVATDSITAVLPPSIAKQFAPNPVLAGTATTLTFTITNPNASLALSGVAFSDTLPTSPGAMVVAPVPAATTSGCGAPTFTPSAGSGSISFSGGTLAAGGTCTVTVNVVAPVAGSYANTSGAVSHLVNGVPVNGNTASDTLTATPANPAIALLKQVGPTASGPWSSFLAVPVGGNVFYRFTVENIGNVPLSSVGVNDPQVSTVSCTWPSPLPVASATDDPTAICIVGPVTAVSGTIPNTATASGTNGTTVTDVSTATYATTGLTIAKSVTEASFAAAGEVLHYSFLVTNSGFAALAGPVTVADDKATDESCPAVTTVGDLDNFLDPGESITCTATYTVTATDVSAGQVTNLASATADGVTSNTDSETVPFSGGPVSAPSIAKVFSPNPIAVGGTSTLTFTITNPNAGTSLTGVAFTDTFPAGLEVAATPNVSMSGCGSPTFAPAAGNTSLSFTGGTIAASGTCTASVNVTATTSGAKANTTGNVTSTNGGTGNTGSDTLNVNALSAPSISKAFSPNPIAVGGVSTLTFTITNPNAGTSLTGVSFTDTFPAGLEVAATPSVSMSGCGSPTFTPAAGNTSLSFTGGTIAASGTCTVSVNVTATTNGAKANTTGNVTSTNGGTGNTGSDTLDVIAPPSIAKAFSPNPISVGGVSTLTFTITNPNAGTSLTGVSFTDTFPAGLEVAATPSVSMSGCGSPTFAPAAGSTSLSFSGGTIAASGTCTVSVNVTATTSGAKANTTGNVTSTNGGTGNTGSDTLNVIAPPSIAKVFSPNPISVGGVSTLTFTITNPNAGTSLTGVAFTDTFPAGLEVAATPSVSMSGCGSPTFTPAAGNTSLSFTGGTIAASGTCTVSVNVTATTNGAKANTTGNVTSTNGGTGNTGSDTLNVIAPPSIAKAFSPNPISVGGVSTLTFTITNPNAGTSLTGVSFMDTFPAGLEVAATPSVSMSGCGSPTFAPAAGNTSLSFSGGTIAASGTCTVSVNVTATTSGAKANTTGNVTSTNGGTGNTGSDTLNVIAPPSIAKAFSPNPISVGGVSTLTFTITNPNAGTSLTGASFTDTFPAGLEVAATPSVSMSGCGSPTFTPAAGNTSLSFTGGTIAASGTCTVSVNVTATTNGAKANTTGNVTSTNGGTGNTGSDTLDVIAPPSIAKAFSPNPISVGGVSTLTFTITNPNAGTSLTGVSFTDTFPAGLEVAATPSVSMSGCGSPTFTPAAGNTSLSFTGGTIAASGTCTVSVNVTATTNGAKANTTGNVTSTNGGTGNTGSDTLDVIAPPSIAKAFSPNPISVGGVSTLTFTITNPNAGTSLTGVSFTDTFPAGLEVAATPSVSMSGCGSPTFTPAAGNTSLSFTGGTIAASGTCTVSVNVTATTSGAKANTTGSVTSTNGGTGNTGSDTLNVLSAPSIAKAFSPNPISVGGVSTLTFTITNPNAGTSLTGVSFTDTFPAGLEVAATPSVSMSGCGSPTFSPAAGNTSLSFSGGTIAASGTCTVSVNVTATTSGDKANTTGNVASSNGGTGNTGSDTLMVGTAPGISKSFSPDPILIGGVSTLTFTLTNPNPGFALTGVAFTDTFPAGMQVAATPNVSITGCSSPTFAPAAGDTSVSFTGGTIAASGTCTVAVDVTAMTAGAKVNTTGNVTSTNGGTGNTGTDTLTVIAPPIITKTFSPDSIGIGGVTDLFLVITNPNTGTTLTGVAFTDTFPAGLQVATPLDASFEACGLPTFSPAPGDTSLSFSGATIPPGIGCMVRVAVTATTAGAKVNTTSNVTSTNGGTGNTGTDTLTVLSPPIITKAFSPNPIAVGGVSTMTFTLTNPNVAAALTGVAFTDTFPAGLQVAVTPDVSITNCGSPTFAPVAGNTSLSFSGGTIAASGTCTVSVDVTATTAGTKVNTTSNVTSTNGGTGNTGTATLTVGSTAPLVAALKSSSFVAATNDLDGSGSLSPGDTLVYTIVVTNTGDADALAVVLTDTPGTYTRLVAGSVTTTQGAVTSGNQVGATSVTVDLGTLVATTGQATVSFTVRLDNPFPPGVTTVMNQATISGSNFPNVVSDNPATTPSGDPTVDVVAVAVVIPTLSEWGVILLVLLLAAVAVLRLRAGTPTARNS